MRQAEFEGLASAIRVEIVFSEIVKVREVKPATFIGGGPGRGAQEAGRGRARSSCCWSTPRWRPSSSATSRPKPAPRCSTAPALILEIFGERAATREGVLQVELAHLNYQKSRLVRSWTHLERQRGGFGFLGGPGETQIESDRRLLEDRIKLLEERLDKVKRTRGQQRGSRDAVQIPDRRARRLHQRRQVQPVQPADRGRGVRQGSAVRDPRHHGAQDRAAAWPRGDAVGHGRLRRRPADDARRRVPRHARRGDRGRRDPPRPRRRQSRQRRAGARTC